MKLNIILLVAAGFALLTNGQVKAANLVGAQTYSSAQMEGPGPDVPPVIIKSRFVGSAGKHIASEGPGPDVPPVIIKIARN